MKDKLLSRWRGIRNRRRKKATVLRRQVASLNASVAKLNLTIKRRRDKLSGGPGDKAARYLLGYVGKVETGQNDAPWLRAWEDGLPHDRLDWMIPGNPYCGFGCLAAWYYGAGVLLPDGVVYTPNIVNWAKSGSHFKAVPPTAARPGDLVVFDWNPGTGADHVGLALGPARGGVIETVEANTSPGNAGSQSNGGGVWKRTRPVGFIAAVARPT